MKLSEAAINLYYIAAPSASSARRGIGAPAKLAAAIICIAAFSFTGKYGLGYVLALASVPVLALLLGGFPIRYLLRLSLISLPFCLAIGAYNLFADRSVLFYISGLAVSGGLISFLTLLCRGYFCTLTALEFACSAGIKGLSEALLFYRLPKLFVKTVLMLYRYIFLLIEEAQSLSHAYLLRSPGSRNVRFSQFGAFAGSLLLRSITRAERVGNAMLLRHGGGSPQTCNAAGDVAAPAVTLEHATFAYPNCQSALDDVSLTINRGETVAVIGRNGAGKSTLIALLCALIFPSSGVVTVFGAESCPGPAAVAAVRRRVGAVFQHPDDHLFSNSVREDVAFGPMNLGLGADEVAQRVQTSLQQMHVSHLADYAPYRLSDGEKRRVAIAAALALEPDLLLLDEPTATLDPHSRRQFIDLLPSLPQTKLIATNDLDLALDRADRVLLLDSGRLVRSGGRELLRDKQLLEEHGLELPLKLQA